MSLRREGDSNPRSTDRRTTVFETAAFDRSAISPIIILAAFTTASIPLRGTISPIIYLKQHSPRSLSRCAGPSLQLYILHSIHRGVYPAPRDHLSNYISYTAFTAEFIPLRGTISPIIYLTQHSPRSLSRSAGPSLQLYILHTHSLRVYPAPRDHLSNYISYTAFTAEFIPLRGTISPIINTDSDPDGKSRSYPWIELKR